MKIKYSILVKQYVLTQEAFAYWEGMKKISDNLGSIFAVQPYQLTGNIRPVGGQEKVIGYISAGSKTAFRIFIEHTALPNYAFTTIFDACTQDKDGGFTAQDYSDASIIPLGYFPDPTWPASNPGPPPAVLLYSLKECVDCSVNGKVAVPPFWQ